SRAVLYTLLGLAVAASVLATVILERGFRAATAPSPLEAELARSVRDFAIPRAERSQPNPYAASVGLLDQGRVLFVSNCAGCHGIDGAGKTAVGLGLYPRVPDLRAAPTQRLTDGEIHFIIENGVQLTGMPAWANARRDRADAWKLAAFVRSL